jgi:hypothetical protein
VAQKQGTSTPPPPDRGGNLKYFLAGLLLLGGAAGLWFFLQYQRAPVEVTPLPQAPAVERVNPMAQQELVIEEKDAGTVKPAPKRKVIIREVWGEWDCSGDLASAKVNAVMAENREQVRNCYERRLKINNVLAGNLNLRLKVNATGSVAATAVGGSLGDNEVFSCVRNLTKLWKFPPPAGGECAVVQVPFKFSPRKQ